MLVEDGPIAEGGALAGPVAMAVDFGITMPAGRVALYGQATVAAVLPLAALVPFTKMFVVTAPQTIAALKCRGRVRTWVAWSTHCTECDALLDIQQAFAVCVK